MPRTPYRIDRELRKCAIAGVVGAVWGMVAQASRSLYRSGAVDELALVKTYQQIWGLLFQLPWSAVVLLTLFILVLVMLRSGKPAWPYAGLFGVFLVVVAS